MLLVIPFVLLGSGCVSNGYEIGTPYFEDQEHAIVEEVDVSSVYEDLDIAVSGIDEVNYESAPNGYYTNVDGDSIARPYYAPSIPSGASAKCRDGTYSYSQHRSGTCSHHGGVSTWY